MSSKIFAIVGLPGSGKTTLGNKWADEFKLQFIDDPKTSKENRREEVLALVRGGNSFILSDIFLCDPQVRSRFEATVKEIDPGAAVHYFFFENNTTKCLANVAARNDGRNVEPSIKRLSNIYTIPPLYLPMTIYEKEAA